MLSIEQLWMIAAIAIVLAMGLTLVKVVGKVKLDWWAVFGIVAALVFVALLALVASVKIIQSA
jgi:hypothetical protein